VEEHAPELLDSAETRWIYTLTAAQAGRLPLPPEREPAAAHYRAKALSLLEESVHDLEEMSRGEPDESVIRRLRSRIRAFDQRAELAMFRERWSLESMRQPEVEERCREIWKRLERLERSLPETNGGRG
jgi:hypothetical protein